MYDDSPEELRRRAGIDALVSVRLSGTVQEVYDSLDSHGQTIMFDLMDTFVNSVAPDDYDQYAETVAEMNAIDFLNMIPVNDTDTIIFLLQRDCGDEYDRDTEETEDERNAIDSLFSLTYVRMGRD